jgi:hypothetical protein
MAAACGFILALHGDAAAQTGVGWSGPAGGLWSDPENWNPEVVPNNAPPDTYYTVNINTPGPVVDGGFTIAGLNITDGMLLNEGSNLGFQSESGSTFINGSGEISIQVAAPFAPASIAIGAHLSLSGGGRITMGGAGTARILGGPGTSLTNNSWTISGEGRLLEGFVPMSNFGTISASSGTLLIRAAGLNNGNVMRAIPSGTLHIQGNAGTFDNIGGTVLASGGLVQFSGNLDVTGGTLRSESGGSFEAIASGGGGHRLRSLINESNFVITGSTVDLEGVIINSGTFIVKSGSAMRSDGAVELRGGGTVSMMSGAAFRGIGTEPSLFLSNGTIRGAGTLANTQTLLVGNLGRVVASGGTLFLESVVSNGGTLAADGGTLVIFGRSVGNGGGRIRAVDSQVVFAGGVEVGGGTVESIGLGSVRVEQNDSASFRDLASLNGTMVLENSSTAVCAGEFLGNYQLIMEAGSRIEVEGSARFGTFGQLFAHGAVIKARDPQLGDGPGSYLWTNDGVLEGTVFIDDLQIENNGTLRALDGDQVTVKPNGDGLLNKGTMEARGTGTIVLDGAGGGSLTQQDMGSVAAVDSSSTVKTAGNPTLSGGRIGAGSGSVILSGTTTLNNVVSDARLYQASSGSLIISGSVVNNGSLTLPATSRVIVNGSLTLGTGGTGHYTSNGSMIIGSGGSFNNAGPGGMLDAGIIVGAGTTTVQTGGTLRAHSIRQNRVTLADGASAQIKSAAVGTVDPSRIGSLTIGAAPAVLDITNRVLIWDQSGPGPLATLRALVTSGYAGGAWTGAGITSSDAATTPGHGVGYGEANAVFTAFPANWFGQTIDSTTLLITYTKYGDATLDRVVNLADFNRLAANFGQSGKLWTDGDSTYDGFVNLQDFNRLAANFGLSAGPDGVVDPADWAALAAVVPEPAAAVAIAGAAGLLAQRRRKFHAWR